MSIQWTKKEVEILKAMAAAGKTVDEVLSVLKSRTKHGVVTKAEHMGIKLTPKPVFDEAAFKRIMGTK
jgi:hypothetical protein